jgi:hypothetical protein
MAELPNPDRLRHETADAQLMFLQSEVDTGLTFARIALGSTREQKTSRNAENARKAYDTVNSYLAGVPDSTPGLEGIREKMTQLSEMLRSLGESL